MKKIENEVGCCKYCKKVDTCILSATAPLGKAFGLPQGLTLDICAAVENVLSKKGIQCTRGKDSCPYCREHATCKLQLLISKE